VTTEYLRDSYIGTEMEREHTMQQILEMLAKLQAKTDENQEKRP
jgi:hypothetical protein